MTVTEMPRVIGPTAREARIAEVEGELAELMGLLNVTTAKVVEHLASVLTEDLWAVPGIRSAEHWATWRLGVSPARAKALVGMARRFGELPSTAAAFRSGSLTEDQVGVVAGNVPAHYDRQAAELAQVSMVTQLRHALRPLRAELKLKEDDEKGEKPVEPEREVRFGHDDESGWWRCFMHLPPDEGALMERGLVAGRDAAFVDRHPTEELEKAGRSDVSWADGALRMAHAAISALTKGSVARAERAQVLLHLSLDDPDHPAYLHLGPALSAQLRRLMTCDARTRVIFEHHGIPVALGRRQHTVPYYLRQVIEDRDGGCRVPGCEQRRWVAVHHLVHWEDGGLTNPENLCCLCATHHRQHHLGSLGIDGDPTKPDGLRFRDTRTGRDLARPPPKPPPGSPAEAARRLGLPQPRWEGPVGERMDYWCVSWHKERSSSN